jgi:hypothetical protein
MVHMRVLQGTQCTDKMDNLSSCQFYSSYKFIKGLAGILLLAWGIVSTAHQEEAAWPFIRGLGLVILSLE